MFVQHSRCHGGRLYSTTLGWVREVALNGLAIILHHPLHLHQSLDMAHVLQICPSEHRCGTRTPYVAYNRANVSGLRAPKLKRPLTRPLGLARRPCIFQALVHAHALPVGPFSGPRVAYGPGQLLRRACGRLPPLGIPLSLPQISISVVETNSGW